MSRTLVQCVVVLYECTFDDSGTLQSLANLSLKESDVAQQIALLIYDNSQNAQAGDLRRWNFGAVEYRHVSHNGGLAAAYNEALQMAHEAELEWLLLLDQDAVVPEGLLPAVIKAVESHPPSNICAFVPKLMQNGRVLSPQNVGRFHNLDIETSFSGICKGRVTAFNSGACLRVEALTMIGGFSREYWLDFLDHITFYKLQASGGQILVLDVIVQHQLSVVNLETQMSLQRYENLLKYEWRFVRETGVGGGPFLHRLRLLKRAVSHSITLRNKTYAVKTFHAMLH